MPKLPGRVWYASSDRDPTVLVALDLEYSERHARWFDTVKERIMTIAEVRDISPEHFVFMRDAAEGGGTYTFVPLTLPLYERWVKHRLRVPHEVPDEEAMLKGLESSREDAW